MLKFYISLFLTIFSITASAQFNGDGYYRLQNHITERYAYLIDDKGEVSLSTTSVDLYAIRLWSGFEKASSDPATILYISKKRESGTYMDIDISGQGTNLYSIIDMYLTTRKNSDNTYFAYGEVSGMTRYLSDGIEDTYFEGSWLIDNGKGDIRKWRIKPVDANGEYFGILPEVSSNGKHYASFYASFPFSFQSSGMKACYISNTAVYEGVGFAIYEEIASDIIPESVPMFIECSTTSPSTNKLNIGGVSNAKITNNVLKGVYFNNQMKGHENYILNDKNTMRVLGKDANGNLAYVISNEKYLPANKAYITVPANSPESFQVVTEQEYNDYVSKHGGVNTIVSTTNASFDVYNILGVKIKSNATSLEGLPAGVYIANGKKHIIR